ncbi:uncharacterized protein MONOS_11989 [Monocercomonoides exilis]|uniref:uncharacterized protein n=1 Tax=Monocercomonoides exilis TaxID=2049356 RepID=UPI003559A3EB|nr:hypothetical protein MONOS_11989 [Monocercomonoides exilis]|eukprot:MONOS_11989.1-p1 / transcript=MONOS_11989.1 / gene=MONOS_11989 / organism=Monocercomonoides_exilis_PA203 / gene_product=unspecified product / transcript_product=unspecified product / location=Mono_scaffold00633:27438-28099(-) / protein_length=152 / sequence_SO=supercontig / SO=protein_coding / is_pseudo=false
MLINLSEPNEDVAFESPVEPSSTRAARRSTSPFQRRRSEEKKSSENDKTSSAPAIDPSDASAVAAPYMLAGAMDDIKRWLKWGVVCAYDVALSAMLSVPLAAPLPSLAASVGTKLRRKRIYADADVNEFPSIFDLFVLSQLPSVIARLESL